MPTANSCNIINIINIIIIITWYETLYNWL